MAVLLQLKDISKSYGARKLLDGVTVSFSEGQKIGVIGRNGEGKSTLCKIITGHDTSDSGVISKNSDLRLSYLEQHDPFEEGESVADFLMRYTGKEEWQCGEIASKFRIDYEVLQRQVRELAGGFQTRVKLASMLLRDPNFLILDEPSNYLDLSTLILLENFLVTFKGGYLVVSHDREFLKRTCDMTLEIEQGSATLYPGNVDDFFDFKEEQLRQKLAYNRNVEKKKQQLERFVERFGAKASQATRAKSKMKQIAKLKTIDIAHRMSTVNIRIPEIENKAGIALEVSDLEIGYPDKTIARGIQMSFDRGDHVAVLGDNGQGKTTFLRTIVGDLQKKSGHLKWGTGLKIAYYAQHVFQKLHPEDDIYAHLQREAAPSVTAQDILDMAGCFLFKGDDVKKKVKVLSGGERARLCLAGLLLSKSQVLLLDEPTNHLDFETVEALAGALRKFKGTVFVISHDRTFVNSMATSIIEVKDGTILKYPGTYEDYVYHLEVLARGDETNNESDEEETPKKRRKNANKARYKEEDNETGKQRTKKLKAQITRLKIKINKVEIRITNLNKEKERLVEEAYKNPFNFSPERNQMIEKLEKNIESEELEWEKLNEKFEELKNEDIF